MNNLFLLLLTGLILQAVSIAPRLALTTGLHIRRRPFRHNLLRTGAALIGVYALNDADYVLLVGEIALLFAMQEKV